MKERDHQIDNVRSLLMVFVVFGHALEILRKTSKVAEVLYTFIYLFHMPVFIFITGYLSKNTVKGQQGAARTFLVPYLLFNTIWNIVAVITGSLSSQSPSVEFSFFTPGWALWYILALFVWKVLLPDMAKMRRPILVLMIMGLFSRLVGEIDTFMSISRIIVFAPYFMSGYLTDRSSLNKAKHWNKALVFLFVGIGILFSYTYVVELGLMPEFLWGDRAYHNFDIPLIYSLILALILYIIGFIAIPCCFKLVRTSPSRLSRIGRNTLPVYIIHPYIVGPISLFLYKLIPNEFIIIIVTFGLSIMCAYGLSQPWINNILDKTLKKFDQLVFREV